MTMSMRPTDEQIRTMQEAQIRRLDAELKANGGRLRTDEQIQHDVDEAIAHENRITNAMTTEEMIREIHGWLSELMPAARVAAKMMNARANLLARWRGGKG